MVSFASKLGILIVIALSALRSWVRVRLGVGTDSRVRNIAYVGQKVEPPLYEPGPSDWMRLCTAREARAV